MRLTDLAAFLTARATSAAARPCAHCKTTRASTTATPTEEDQADDKPIVVLTEVAFTQSQRRPRDRGRAVRSIRDSP